MLNNLDSTIDVAWIKGSVQLRIISKGLVRSQDGAVWWIPHVSWSLCRRIEWSVVSKAAERSSRVKMDISLRSEAWRRSLMIFRRAVSLLWSARHGMLIVLEIEGCCRWDAGWSGEERFFSPEVWIWRADLKRVCSSSAGWGKDLTVWEGGGRWQSWKRMGI